MALQGRPQPTHDAQSYDDVLASVRYLRKTGAQRLQLWVSA
jgi:hypothetical protein